MPAADWDAADSYGARDFSIYHSSCVIHISLKYIQIPHKIKAIIKCHGERGGGAGVATSTTLFFESYP
jgi:hypothetical protein